MTTTTAAERLTVALQRLAVVLARLARSQSATERRLAAVIARDRVAREQAPIPR